MKAFLEENVMISIQILESVNRLVFIHEYLSATIII